MKTYRYRDCLLNSRLRIIKIKVTYLSYCVVRNDGQTAPTIHDNGYQPFTYSLVSGKAMTTEAGHKKRPAISDRSEFFNLVTLSEDKRLDQASRNKSNYIC